jgi:hypothetical protein
MMSVSTCAFGSERSRIISKLRQITKHAIKLVFSGVSIKNGATKSSAKESFSFQTDISATDCSTAHSVRTILLNIKFALAKYRLWRKTMSTIGKGRNASARTFRCAAVVLSSQPWAEIM